MSKLISLLVLVFFLGNSVVNVCAADTSSVGDLIKQNRKIQCIESHPLMGQTAPDFKCLDSNGNEVGLNNFKGKLVLLIIGTTNGFWFRGMARSCQNICNELKSKEFVLVWIIGGEFSFDDVKLALLEQNVNFSIVRVRPDFYSDLAKLYSVEFADPYLFVLDSERKVIGVEHGYLSESVLREWLFPYLAKNVIINENDIDFLSLSEIDRLRDEGIEQIACADFAVQREYDMYKEKRLEWSRQDEVRVKEPYYKEALEKLDKVLQVYPNDLYARHFKTIALSRLEGYDKAYREALELSAIYPDNPRLLASAATYALDSGRPQEAVKLQRKVLQLLPKAVELYHSQGNLCSFSNLQNTLTSPQERESFLREAEACYRKAIELFDGWAYWSALGRVQMNLGEYRGSIQSLSSALERAKKFYAAETDEDKKTISKKRLCEIYNNMGYSYYKLNMLKESYECFSNTLSLDPQNAYAKKMLATEDTDRQDTQDTDSFPSNRQGVPNPR